jgi:hypothetical protein
LFMKLFPPENTPRRILFMKWFAHITICVHFHFLIVWYCE